MAEVINLDIGPVQGKGLTQTQRATNGCLGATWPKVGLSFTQCIGEMIGSHAQMVAGVSRRRSSQGRKRGPVRGVTSVRRTIPTKGEITSDTRPQTRGLKPR